MKRESVVPISAQVIEAEELADLQPQTGGLGHPYRRKWATERKHLLDLDVAAGGWLEDRADPRDGVPAG